MTRSYSRYALSYYSKAHPLEEGQGRAVVDGLAISLPEFNVAQYFGSQPTIFKDYDHLVVARARAGGGAIGLLGARWLGGEAEKFLYLWTAMVADEYRQTLLFHRILQFFFETVFNQPAGVPELIVTKTYNPVVYALFKAFSKSLPGVEVYPVIPSERQDDAWCKRAIRITAGISAKLTLDVQSGLIAGGQAMVAPDFFPRMDLSKDMAVNEHFARHLSRADQILCVLRIAPDAAAGARAWAATQRERNESEVPE